MTTFPNLKTHAVAQYPATKAILFHNQILRFVDGLEQRYRDSAGPLRRWTIRLDALDAAELATLEEFFLANQGRFGSFDFTDPWDGQTYSNCNLQEDALETVTTGEIRGKTSLTVLQNRA